MSNILQLTAHHIGITFLPEIVARAELQAGRLAAFGIADYEMQMLTQLIYRKDKWVSPAIREFIRLCAAFGAEETEKF